MKFSESDQQTLRLKDTHPTYKKIDQLRALALKLKLTLMWSAADQRFEVEDASRPGQMFYLQTESGSPEHPVFPAVMNEESVMTELSVHTRVDCRVYAQENGDDY